MARVGRYARFLFGSGIGWLLADALAADAGWTYMIGFIFGVAVSGVEDALRERRR